METMELVLVVVAAVLAGLVLALKRIAPRTKNTLDDKLLNLAEPASDVLDSVVVPKEEPKED